MSICPNQGNVDECKKKPRCAWGECDGQMLPSDPEDYCPTGYSFREEYCDCEPEGCYEPGLYLVTWAANFNKTARKNCSTNPVCFLDCEQDPVVDCGPSLVEGSFFWTINSASSCIVPRFYTEYVDICSETRPSATGSIFACAENADPDLGECGIAIDGFTTSGCSPGSAGGTYTLNVDLVE